MKIIIFLILFLKIIKADVISPEVCNDEFISNKLNKSLFIILGKVENIGENEKYSYYSYYINNLSTHKFIKNQVSITVSVSKCLSRVNSSFIKEDTIALFNNKRFYNRMTYIDSVLSKVYNPILDEGNDYIFLINIDPKASIEQKTDIYLIQAVFKPEYLFNIERNFKKTKKIDSYKLFEIKKSVLKDTFYKSNDWDSIYIEQFKLLNKQDDIVLDGFGKDDEEVFMDSLLKGECILVPRKLEENDSEETTNKINNELITKKNKVFGLRNNIVILIFVFILLYLLKKSKILTLFQKQGDL